MPITVQADIDRIPVDLLAHIFSLISCFRDLALLCRVCRKWNSAVKQSFAIKERLSFFGFELIDSIVSRIVEASHNIRELEIPHSFFGSQIYDVTLHRISSAKCVNNLTSISLTGIIVITDNGFVQLVSRATSLQHVDIGYTYLTDKSLFAISDNCPHLKSIVLWGCSNVTENGLFALVNKCQKLESININVRGINVPADCFNRLLSIRPTLQLN